jgi:hypothetical protein
VEFPNSLSLEILNQGNEPTFCGGCRLGVVDITIGSFGLQAGRFHQSPPCWTRHSIHFTGLSTSMHDQEP